MRLIISVILCLISTIGLGQELQFDWGIHIGGSQNEFLNDAILDGSGNIYTIGTFRSPVDFDPGVSEFILDPDSGGDIFISKLGADGSFIWAKQIEGNYSKTAHSIDIDPNGNLYLTGQFVGTADFDPGPSSHNMSSNGWYDIFILKLSSLGEFVWAKQIGGASVDRGWSISVDELGNVHTTGSYLGSVDFDPNGGTFILPSQDEDIFVSKLDTNGNFLWAKRLGGAEIDTGIGIEVDDSGNVWTVGQFRGVADFNPSSNDFLLESAGSEDIFISKLRYDGLFIFARQLSGTSLEQTEKIILDNSNNILITGYFYGSTDFDPGPDTFYLSAIELDSFICKIDDSGDFVWAKQFQGPSVEHTDSIVTDEQGNVYTTGGFNSQIDLDPGSGVYSLSTIAPWNGFISKLDSEGDFIWGRQIVADYITGGNSILVNQANEVFVTGLFFYTVYLDPNLSFTTNGIRDVFIQKLKQQPLGVLESSLDRPIVFYPNPTRNNLFLDLNENHRNITITVTNEVGQVVSTEKIIQAQHLTIGIEGSSGIYFVNILFDGRNSSKLKVIKY